MRSFIFVTAKWKVPFLTAKICIFVPNSVRALGRVKGSGDVTGCIRSLRQRFGVFVYSWFLVELVRKISDYPCKTMSDSEHSSSDSSSERSEAMSASDGEGSSCCFLFKSNFAPYQGEPLAGDGEMADNDGEEEEEEGDEDGLLPSVLAQRFEGRVAVNEW